jgi:hypothetical protein
MQFYLQTKHILMSKTEKEKQLKKGEERPWEPNRPRPGFGPRQTYLRARNGIAATAFGH